MDPGIFQVAFSSRMPAILEISPTRHMWSCNRAVPFEKSDNHYWLKPANDPVPTEKQNQNSCTPANSSSPICRICHEGDGKEELVAPCRCSGSMGLVHRSCLERWLSSSNSDACEICKFKFVIFKQPKSFSEWVFNPPSPEECRNLVGDLLCFTLLTPLAAVSSYLCFSGAKHYASWSTKWEASGLICLSVMLIAIYLTWCFVTVRYHLRNWKSWRTTHQNVYLVQMRQLSVSQHAIGQYLNNNSNLGDNNNNHYLASNNGNNSSRMNSNRVLSISSNFGNTSSIASGRSRCSNTPCSVISGASPQSPGPIYAAMVEMVSLDMDSAESAAHSSGHIRSSRHFRSSSLLEFPRCS